ncbi:SGNH/GDSL hydrolase family protein [Nostoc sp. 106C]|uniref:SGNH/GDSL hydrolase family protein n=1 Tax=Nostoc sp. 106C TaxID=1932667 RepID=UPI000A381540|nr:SGNH/GDSL hydrolase family protein [Nostoc sp. 106C]OUL30821.1 lysophospholipase [Nostoc sp. 106C]
MKFLSKCWKPAIWITAAFVTTEVVLRLTFGLGNPVLSQADTYTGYRFQPNQKLFRFGKRIEYNQYSQRSNAITKEKPKGTLRILMVGDSVLNGGNPTDQRQIITELLKNKIQETGHQVEVLNASAGSWGIGNRLGYLREFGTFQSDAVILEIGTDDLPQPTSTSAPVGHDPSYPDHAPLLATQEAFIRYVLPHFSIIFNSAKASTATNTINTLSQPNQQFQQNMKLLKNTVELVRAEHIPVYILFSPNRSDLIPNFSTPNYKLKFLQVANLLQVPIIDLHKAWSNQPGGTVATYFRDNVHLNASGNEAAASVLFQQLCIEKKFKTCSKTQL